MSTELKRPRGRPRKYPAPPGAPGALGAKPFSQPSLKLPLRQMRQIEQIAKAARITADQVLEDVLDQGLLQVTEMYQDLIDCRKRLEQRKDERFRPHRQPALPAYNGTPGTGQPDENGNSGAGPEPDDASERSGLAPTLEADTETAGQPDTMVIESEGFYP
jgi:hypothetical protein